MSNSRNEKKLTPSLLIVKTLVQKSGRVKDEQIPASIFWLKGERKRGTVAIKEEEIDEERTEKLREGKTLPNCNQAHFYTKL